MVRRAGREASGVSIKDPAAAQGTTLPSMGPFLGGPPHALYPVLLSELVMPQISSEYPGNSFLRSMQKTRCARVAVIALATQSVCGARVSRRPRKSAQANGY